MHIEVKNKRYVANITNCGEAITLYDEAGEEVTVVPREKYWEETAVAAITSIVTARERITA